MVEEGGRELVDADRRAPRWEFPAFLSSLSYTCKFSMHESTGEHRRWPRLQSLAITPQEAPLDKDLPTKGCMLDYPWQGWECPGERVETDLSYLRECTGEALESKDVPSPSKRAGIWTPDTLGEPLLK